jgi:2-dehydropantoate 2-reductase
LQVVVVGAGSIGTTLALLLAERAEVTVAVRAAETAASLAANGLTSTGAFTRRAVLPVCTLDAAPLADDTFVVVAVRAQHVRSTLGSLGGHLSPRAPIVLAMDGLGVLDDARAARPDHVAWIRAACAIDAREDAPGRVQVGALEGFALGATGGALAAVRQLEGAIVASGVATTVEFDPRAVEWRRALPAVAVAALCAVVGREDRAASDEPELRAIAESAIDEALRVAAADGVHLGPPDRHRAMAAIEAGRDRPGVVLEDLATGRPTELPFLSGGVVRAGRRLGVATPVHDTLASLAAYLERKASAAFRD